MILEYETSVQECFFYRKLDFDLGSSSSFNELSPKAEFRSSNCLVVGMVIGDRCGEHDVELGRNGLTISHEVF